VPSHFSTIQKAINQSANGDTVLVSRGVYKESLKIDGKSFTLSSNFIHSKDKTDIRETILDGNGATILEIKNVDTTMTLIGFTFRNADDGISARARFNFLYNYVTDCNDGIDYESGGGGLCRYNVFFQNKDDAIDLDGDVDIIIEDNILRDNKDDGIEIRLQEYDGPQLTYIIRRNEITGNGEDGIQIIDYPDLSNRIFYIQNNIISKTAMAAIGCMSNGNTREDYEAASIPERIFLINNTIVDNHYGITGGDNMIVLNNIIAQTQKIAIKNIDGNSIIGYNCLWLNGTDIVESNGDDSYLIKSDPKLNKKFRLKKISPCIDKGSHNFKKKGKILYSFPKESFTGKAPDIGAFEYGHTIWEFDNLE